MPNFKPEPNEASPDLYDSEHIALLGDDEFDQTFPETIQKLSRTHWTPVEVGRSASRFLVTEPGTRVLDVGCGPGKFCAIGAATTKGHFTGIEQRELLVLTARQMLKTLKISRVEIIHANALDVSFKMFDAFYLFNPFMENVFPTMRIDLDVELEPRLYTKYSAYVCAQLSLAPVGTRVASYCCVGNFLPQDYRCKHVAFDGKLKFWIKSPKTVAISSRREALNRPRLMARWVN